MRRLLCLACALTALLVLSCRQPAGTLHPRERYAVWFELGEDALVSFSPYDGHADTLRLDAPLRRLVCMSSSYVGFLDALGCDSLVVGVSGIGYLSSPQIQKRYAAGEVFDVGYDAAPDFERIVALHPDLVVAYSVSAAPSPFLTRLQELGIPVLQVYEHLENHPLARAEYLRLFGALAGCRDRSDSLFDAICAAYDSLCVAPQEKPVRVLLNVPYADQWFIPGGENYMARLIRDAGGQVLGAQPGAVSSRVISLEEAWRLAGQADLWLNPGGFSSRGQLYSALPAFAPLDIPTIYNNTRRMTSAGGNDFWESGPVRPDLVLKDLRQILASDIRDSLYYYLPVR